MALTESIKSGLVLLDLEYNQIGSEGCEYLSQTKWPNLKYLYLSNNNITSEGVKQLCKSNWPLLEQLSLCTLVIFRFKPNWK